MDPLDPCGAPFDSGGGRNDPNTSTQFISSSELRGRDSLLLNAGFEMNSNLSSRDLENR